MIKAEGVANIDFIKASKLQFDPLPQMGKIFVDGFYELGLKFISNDKAKLARGLSHIFQLDDFYVVIDGGKIAALTGCYDGKSPIIIMFNKKIMRKEMGFFLGSFAYLMLNKVMGGHKYPFEFTPQTGAIEFVAVSEDYRGRGIGGDLINHIMENETYAEYVLEVADNNTPAVKLYKKLGFVEFMRTPAPKRSGFSEYVYMRKVRRK